MKVMSDTWLCAPQIFNGFSLLDNHAIQIKEGIITAILPQSEMPINAKKQSFDGIICPGFFDIQVNGGADVLFNNQPNKAGLAKISTALRQAGTTHWLPTVITDSPDVLTATCDTIMENYGTMGIAGIHIEGPHIAIERRGTHKSRWIRPFDDHSLTQVTKLRSRNIPVLMTVASEMMKKGEVARLVEMGVVVSIGHSNANAETTKQTVAEGAQLFTHLFNAMSQIENRDLNVVGTAINSDRYCSIIADGFHVDLGLLGLATRARPVADRMILVTDAMPTVGGSDEFMLYGNKIKLENGRLINSEGSLAGAHITMLEEVRNMVQKVGQPLETVLRMATSNPAMLIKLGGSIGKIQVGSMADIIVISANLKTVSCVT
ncbi:MAG: N-acetylglucosamine-6-phosphate deacetylase [Rhodobacteraceae bacterium]|nr:N-acetylglucosamine-6-phosphate deacetylase [Paracoccaceae bacterium]